MALMRRVLVAAALAGAVVAPGCDKKDPGGESKPAEKSAKAKPAAEEAPPPAPQARSWKELFAGKAVQMPAPAAGLKIGMPLEDGKKLAPTLFDESRYGKLEGFADVKLNVDLNRAGDRVRNVRLKLPADVPTVKAHLTSLWGEPRVAEKAGGGQKYYWSNAAEGLRAYLQDIGATQVIFEPVMSVETFLGADTPQFGFAKGPLIGQDVAQLKQDYPAWIGGDTPDRVSLTLPPLEQSEHPGSVSLNLADNRVTHYTIQVSFGMDPKAKEQIVAGLRKKFGEPKVGKMYSDYGSQPPVKIDAGNDDRMVIWVGKKP